MMVESAVHRAVLFSSSAHVTRRALLQIPRGTAKVALRGLPPGLDPGQLSIITTAGLVRAVDIDEIPGEPNPISDVQVLELAEEALDAKLARIEADLTALNLELELIDRVTPENATNLASSPLRPDVFLKGLNLVMERRVDTLERIATLKTEHRSTLRERTRIQTQRTAIGMGDANAKQSVLVVSLESEAAAECVLDLTYELGFATWRPYYQLRVDAEGRSLECARFADIIQETGEDWRKVTLGLSTAVPQNGLVVPKVIPWVLGVAHSYQAELGGLYQAKARTMNRVAPEQNKRAVPEPQLRDDDSPELDESSTTGDVFDYEESGNLPVLTAASVAQERGGAVGFGQAMPPPGLPPPAGPARSPARRAKGGAIEAPSVRLARRRQQEEVSPPEDREAMRFEDTPLPELAGIDHQFEVAGQVDCASGAVRQRVDLGSTRYDVDLTYLLRPAVKDYAFGRVKLVHNDRSPFLAGVAAVFLGDAFFAETKIETTPGGGTLHLDLGAETSIKCARRSRTTVRTEGLLTKEDIHAVEVKIDIENFLSRSAELVIEDQIPVSVDPKIKVRLVKTVPKNATLDELTGILTFKTKLGPATKLELEFAYEIEAPKDYEFRQHL